MRLHYLAPLALATLLLSGCNEDGPTAPHRDTTPPAAPRGVYSVTGDHQVTLHWLSNTESDVAGYRIYESPCESGDNCPYDRVGTTASTAYVVSGLSNGTTRYFAVAAVDAYGNESDLSYETIYDTPRPAGYGATLVNYLTTPTGAGWDFSAAMTRSSSDPATDIFFGDNGSVSQMFALDLMTDIQDMGWASNLDAIDYAPPAGWSPTGSVELIPGHCYIVWTRDNHYAKFRVSSLSSAAVVFDWAYQTDPGNGELRAGRAGGTATPRPIAWLR